MADTPPIASREPGGITLADLLALVVGVAVVATIPWSYWFHPTDSLRPWPRWVPYLWAARQVLGMACLALVPVVLARRARYGGVARPAEFLASCCGLPVLAASVELLLIRRFVRLRSGIVVSRLLDGAPTSLTSEWQRGPHWTWKYGLLIAAVLAISSFLGGRRRLPGWLLTTLLLIAWIGFYDTGPELMMIGAGRLVLRFGSSFDELSGAVVHGLLYDLPRFLLYAVPALLVLRDFRHADRPRWTWLEWTGTGLAALLFLISETGELSCIWGAAWPQRPYLQETIAREMSMLGAIALGFLLIRRLGPAWSRHVGPVSTET